MSVSLLLGLSQYSSIRFLNFTFHLRGFGEGSWLKLCFFFCLPTSQDVLFMERLLLGSLLVARGDTQSPAFYRPCSPVFHHCHFRSKTKNDHHGPFSGPMLLDLRAQAALQARQAGGMSCASECAYCTHAIPTNVQFTRIRSSHTIILHIRTQITHDRDTESTYKSHTNRTPFLHNVLNATPLPTLRGTV
jgi:hypothetical protein